MFASVSRRLTIWYVTAAVVLVTLVMAALAVVALVFYGRLLQESIAADAVEAQAFASRAAERHERFANAALEFERRSHRSGIHIIASDAPRPPRTGRAGFTRTALVSIPIQYGLPPSGAGSAPPRPAFNVIGGNAPTSTARPGDGGPDGPPPEAAPYPAPAARRGAGPGYDPANQIVFADGAIERGSPLNLRTRGSRFGFVALALTNTQAVTMAFLNGRMFIAPDADYFGRIVAALFGAVALAALFAAVLAWTVGRFITAQALQPLVDVTGRLQRFATRDFSPEPIDVASRSEFAVLAHAYNAAAAQVAEAFVEREAAETHMRQFVADAGHELRTPLTILLGYLDVLKRRGENERTNRIYETMTIEGQRMRTLIDNLILLARLDSDQARPIEPFDLSELLRKDIVEPRRVIAPGVTFALDIGVNATIIADRTEIYEAIANVVDNALKYAPGSPISIAVRRAGAMISIDVADQGPGIAEGDRSAVFDRFYRGEKRGEVEGSGLGLAIAKRAIERAGGSLALANTSAAGTTFRVLLRADRAREAASTAAYV
jgi:two-component system OmpR family sensor kinase